MNGLINKDYKKGFTLVELLAVIIVLAVIMVIAIPSVLDTSSGAQLKSFKTYAERVGNKAIEVYTSNKLINGNSAKKEYNLLELGFKSTGTFVGTVVIEDSDSSGQINNDLEAKVTLCNGKYSITGMNVNDINGAAVGTGNNNIVATSICNEPTTTNP